MKTITFYILWLVTYSTACAQWTTNGSDIYFNSGNVGLGTGNPSTKISFTDVNGHSNAEGLTWYAPSPWGYGIYRTAGSWSGPDYQQLKLAWATGIVLDPGNDYGKSYVDIQGGGLRVTSGRVGIGTASPAAPFEVYSNTAVAENNGAQFSALSIGPHRSHIHYGTTGNWYIRSAAASGNVIIQDTGGNVGIGTTSPGGRLDVNAGSLYAIRTATSNRYIIEVRNTGDVNGGWWLANDANGNFALHENAVGDQLTVQAGGNVGIGTNNPDAKLSVKGLIHAQEVKVDLNGAVAPDYVFDKEYRLPSLKEVQSYITTNKHLPEVPSAKEMEENGLNLGEMNLLLLKKVEELTLYAIEQERRYERQEAELNAQRAALQQLKDLISQTKN